MLGNLVTHSERHYTHTLSLLQSEVHPHHPESCVVEDPQAVQPGQEDVCKIMLNM